MIFDVRVVRDDRWEVLAVVGEVDLATAPAFRGAMVEAAAAARRERRGLAVDLTGCDLIDSIGLGIVLGGLRRARSGGLPFGVVVADPRLRALFERCRLDEILDLVPDRSGLAALAPEPPGARRGG